MAPKAVEATKRLTRNQRFRGHGPLLQKLGPIPRRAVHPDHPPYIRFATSSSSTSVAPPPIACTRASRDMRSIALSRM
jgi:hypothetical protein